MFAECLCSHIFASFLEVLQRLAACPLFVGTLRSSPVNPCLSLDFYPAGAGLPMTHCECIDSEYWRLIEGEAPVELFWELENIINDIKGIERQISKCLRKHADRIDQAYWVDWDRGACSMSPDLTEALADLANVIRGFNKRQAPAIEKLLPSAKASGQPRHGWTTWGLEA